MSKRYQQPQSPAQIDWGNPFTRGLIEVYDPGSLTSRIDNAGFSATGSTGDVVNKSGQATFALAASAAGYTRSFARLTSVAECSILAVVTPIAAPTATTAYGGAGSTANANPLFLIGTGSTTATQVSFRVRNLAGTNQELTSASGLIVAGKQIIVGGSRSESQNFHRVFVDGVRAATAAAAAIGATAFNTFAAHGLLRTTFGLQAGSEINLLMAWNRALSDEEFKALSANPWQLFAPQARQLWMPTATGGGVLLQASAAADSAVTASLTTAIVLASSATATATATASLSTGIPLAAAASSVSTVTASLTTGIALASNAVSGATATAALTATGTGLTANASSSATVTATLSTGIPLASAAVATATATAALSTAIVLASGAAASATATASLSTGINLAAAASASATATAALTTTAQGMAANATSGATATASLSTGIALSASAVSAATSTASLLTAIKLSASVQAQATATADLTATGAAWGASAIAGSVASANLTTQILLTISASARVTVTATLASTSNNTGVVVINARTFLPIAQTRTLPVDAQNRKLTLTT